MISIIYLYLLSSISYLLFIENYIIKYIHKLRKQSQCVFCRINMIYGKSETVYISIPQIEDLNSGSSKSSLLHHDSSDQIAYQSFYCLDSNELKIKVCV